MYIIAKHLMDSDQSGANFGTMLKLGVLFSSLNGQEQQIKLEEKRYQPISHLKFLKTYLALGKSLLCI